MAHQIDTLADANIIVVKYSGDVGLKERLSAVVEVCDMLNDTSCVRLLIDIRQINNTMSNEQQQYFGRYLANKPELKNAKVAVLSEQLERNANLVINNTAYLEGYHVAPFNSRGEAISWLAGMTH